MASAAGGAGEAWCGAPGPISGAPNSGLTFSRIMRCTIKRAPSADYCPRLTRRPEPPAAARSARGTTLRPLSAFPYARAALPGAAWARSSPCPQMLARLLGRPAPGPARCHTNASESLSLGGVGRPRPLRRLRIALSSPAPLGGARASAAPLPRACRHRSGVRRVDWIQRKRAGAPGTLSAELGDWGGEVDLDGAHPLRVPVQRRRGALPPPLRSGPSSRTERPPGASGRQSGQGWAAHVPGARGELRPRPDVRAGQPIDLAQRIIVGQE